MKPGRFSPTRISGRELESALQLQMHERHTRGRDYVPGKVGERDRSNAHYTPSTHHSPSAPGQRYDQQLPPQQATPTRDPPQQPAQPELHGQQQQQHQQQRYPQDATWLHNDHATQQHQQTPPQVQQQQQPPSHFTDHVHAAPAHQQPPQPQHSAAHVHDPPSPGFARHETVAPHHRRRFVHHDEQVKLLQNTRELSAILEAQMTEKEARKREEQQRERQRSRELMAQRGVGPNLSHSGPPAMSVWSDADPGDSDAAAGGNPTFDPTGTTDAAPKRSSPMNRVSPDRFATGRHISPERIRETEFELRSGVKLFDHEQRELRERMRQQQQVRAQEELKDALEQQIADQRRRKDEALRKEKELDLLMERRAQREAAELANMERRRDEEAARAAMEAKSINMQIAERHPPPEPAPHRRASRVRPSPSVAGDASLHESPIRGDQSADMTSASPPPMRSSTETDEMKQLLSDIRNELLHLRNRPLPDVEPPKRISPPPSTHVSQSTHVEEPPHAYGQPATGAFAAPNLSPPMRTPQPAHTPAPYAQPPQPVHSNNLFMQRDTDRDVATAVLERNQKRLAALRYAGSHDDILKAFLLQDSTAAVRAVSQFKTRQPGGASYGATGPGRSHSSLY